MAMKLEQIEDEIRALSDDERMHLLHDLITEMDAPADENVEAAWQQEIQRRFQQLQQGAVEAIPASRVLQQVKDYLKDIGQKDMDQKDTD